MGHLLTTIEINYTKGKENKVADYLSRNSLPEIIQNNPDEIEINNME